MKLLAKYDIRGIQKFIFRTKKLREIRAVQNIPEQIIFESFKTAVIQSLHLDWNDNVSDDDILLLLQNLGIHILDKAGGNAFVLYDRPDAKQVYKNISMEMAFYILKNTYSLELVYTSVECTDNFYSDYERLNEKLGKLKSQMPSAHPTGAFPICRSDYNTALPIIGKDSYGNDMTMESALKARFHGSLSHSREDNKLDEYILQKGVDSHIAIIHIDGNNMGQRINNILKTANYSNAKAIFSSIKVRDRFAEVCREMQILTQNYIAQMSQSDTSKSNKQIRLVHAVIQAGDDITYITRADIALSFTKKFIELVSEKYMIDNTDDPNYLISACAGIAYIDSHFPFSDGYDLAEACCASAKARAKKYKSPDGYIGNWIDFEICRHIKDVDLSQSRKLYGIIGNTVLTKKPYCIRHSMYDNEFFDFDKFERKIQSLVSQQPILNRSRAKDFREAYSKGYEFVEVLKNSAISRNYLTTGDGEAVVFYEQSPFSENNERLYASYYDALEIMDLYRDFNAKEKTE